MIQRDIIKDQIEQLGQVLGKLLSKAAGLDISSDLHSAVSELQKSFAEDLDINLYDLLDKSFDEVQDNFKNSSFGSQHFEDLSKITLHLSQIKKETNEQISYAKLALIFIQLSDSKSDIYSIERDNLKTQIIKLIG